MSPTFGVSIADLPGSIPSTFLPEEIDLKPCAALVQSFLQSPVQESLTSDALWRDWAVWHPRTQTISTAATITHFLTNLDESTAPSNLQVSPKVHIDPTPLGSWAVVSFTFTSRKANLPTNVSGSASLSLIDNTWKIWSLQTILENFEGHRNPDDPSLNLAGGAIGTSWGSADPLQLDVVIVGGGQNGLCIAGRLGALGIRYVIVERADEIGTTWTRRYASLRQHTNKETNTLPFDRTWEADDEHFLLGKRVGEGFQNYVRKYNINVWLDSQVEKADRDEAAGTWNVKVNKNGETGNVVARHLIFATGSNLSHPSKPTIPGEAEYKGKLLHSIDYRDAKDWSGLKGLVIGSGTQAHDVARDMVDAGLTSVHITQRDKTGIFPINTYRELEARIFNREIPTELVDRMGAGPLKHRAGFFDQLLIALAKQPYTREIHDALERAGFRVDREAAMFDKILNQGGTYYLDVGASQYVIDGRIKVKSNIPVERFTPTGLAFADGSRVDADVVVFCTGYRNDYNEYVGTFVGREIAGQLEPWSGVGEDGDLQGQMHASYPGLWLMGGAAATARWNSRFIALGIQLDVMQANGTAGKHVNGGL